jgi:hypothetical protein
MRAAWKRAGAALLTGVFVIAYVVVLGGLFSWVRHWLGWKK